jgi:hypothetical protein
MTELLLQLVDRPYKYDESDGERRQESSSDDAANQTCSDSQAPSIEFTMAVILACTFWLVLII